jgi:DNA-binding beta-propeller fold protein YncE
LNDSEFLAAGVKWQTVFDTIPGGDWSHSGIGVLSDERLVFEKLGGKGLVLFDEKSKAVTEVATNTQVCHGIFVQGDEVWIADPGSGDTDGQVIRVNLKGEILESVPAPLASQYPGKHWRPTSLAYVAAPGKYFGELWIADGYGRSLIHRRLVSGEIITFDGSESGISFDCPHGIAIDTRGATPQVAVADRSNTRVVFFDMEGNFLRSVSDPIMTSPSSLAVFKDRLVLTDLFGAILSIDQGDRVEALVATAGNNTRPGWPNRMVGEATVAPELSEGVINSPHGITVAPNGKVYFTEWFLGGRVVSLSIS